MNVIEEMKKAQEKHIVEDTARAEKNKRNKENKEQAQLIKTNIMEKMQKVFGYVDKDSFSVQFGGNLTFDIIFPVFKTRKDFKKPEFNYKGYIEVARYGDNNYFFEELFTPELKQPYRDLIEDMGKDLDLPTTLYTTKVNCVHRNKGFDVKAGFELSVNAYKTNDLDEILKGLFYFFGFQFKKLDS